MTTTQDLKLAGFLPRILSKLIDLSTLHMYSLLICAGFIVIFYTLPQEPNLEAIGSIRDAITLNNTENQGVQAIDFCIYLIDIFLTWIYGSVYLSSRQQATYGQHYMHIRVVDKNGKRISKKQAYLRTGVEMVSTLSFGAGYLWALFSKRKQTFHDLIAGTYVIEGRIDTLPPIQLPQTPDPTDILRQHIQADALHTDASPDNASGPHTDASPDTHSKK